MGTAKGEGFEHWLSHLVPVLLAIAVIFIWISSFKYTGILMEADTADILAGHKDIGPDPKLDPEGRFYWRGLLPIHYFLAVGFSVLSISILVRSLTKFWVVAAVLFAVIFVGYYHGKFPTSLHGNLSSKLFVEATCKGNVIPSNTGENERLKEFTCKDQANASGKSNYGEQADFFQKYERILDRLAIFLFVFAAYGTAVPFAVWRRARTGDTRGSGDQGSGWSIARIVRPITNYLSFGPGYNEKELDEASFLVGQKDRLQKLLFGGAALLVFSIVSLAAMFRWLASFYPSPLSSGKSLGLALLNKIPQSEKSERWDSFWKGLEELQWREVVRALRGLMEGGLNKEMPANQIQEAVAGFSSAHWPILEFGMGYTMYWGVMFTFIMLMAIVPPMIILRNRSYELAYRTLQSDTAPKAPAEKKQGTEEEVEKTGDSPVTPSMVREWLEKHQLIWGGRLRVTSLSALFAPLLFGSAMPLTQVLM